MNLSNELFVINPGVRIAQIVVAHYEKVEWDEVEVLDETERGEWDLALRGENFDRNQYALTALELGARYAVVNSSSSVGEVDDPR